MLILLALTLVGKMARQSILLKYYGRVIPQDRPLIFVFQNTIVCLSWPRCILTTQKHSCFHKN